MPRPNILLVVWDSVRARNCSLYGHNNETTPFLREFTQNATVFDQARSPSIHSISSHSSLFTGLHTAEHRIRNHESYLDPTATIWSTLKNKYGYKTGIFTPNAVITKSSNLNEPFDVCVGPKRRTKARLFQDGLSPASVPGGISEYLQASLNDDDFVKSLTNGAYFKLFRSSDSHDPTAESADVYTDHLIEWIKEVNGPWAAFLNLMDAHYPYVPDAEHDRWGSDRIANVRDSLPDLPLSKTFLEGRPWGELHALEPLYDGGIRQLDDALKRLVDKLGQLEEFDDTLIVVTSDHGEGFGERSRLTPPVRLVDHSWGIHESLTHVPLIVKEPGQTTQEYVKNISSLTHFPSVVHAALDGRDAADEFVPHNGRALVSTYRIEPPGDALPIPQAKREPYFGPWRAVYENKGETVRKYATRGDDSLTLDIHSSSSAILTEEAASPVVDEAYDELTPSDVEIGDADERTVGDGVEDHLADLGYLR